MCLMLLVSVSNAYMIGGKYFRLISCKYQQWKVGYQIDHGYVGIYESHDGEMYRIFFGNNYCEY